MQTIFGDVLLLSNVLSKQFYSDPTANRVAINWAVLQVDADTVGAGRWLR
jgi:hypothetical protein